jgi:HD-GYP domain-containing protein (c-di-GMP phosphodiesterase class II)
MNLVNVSIDSIRLSQPLPFSLMDKGGVLLAPKGFVVVDKAYLEQIITQRGKLYIDVSESEAHRRAYVSKLHNLVREDRLLGQIAGAEMSAEDMPAPSTIEDAGVTDWLNLQGQTHAMLRDGNPESFRTRLDKLQAELSRHLDGNPDGALFALIHLSSSEVRMYSATHALLVSVMCSLAAREVLKWPLELQAKVCKIALTMNIGMTELQDRLALQKETPSPAQRELIDQHASRSATVLAQLGITDPRWLEAVREHHAKTPGPLATRTEGQRLARLIQRADMFAARLAPRASRVPESPAMAMQACYFDENKKMDEAGAALIKAMGIYSPGSFVRLTNGEVAVVIKRGANTATPRVAVVLNRSGMPTVEMMVRDTSKPEFRIASGVTHREVKVQINLDRLLALTRIPVSDRPW